MNWQETREALIQAGISGDTLPDEWHRGIYLYEAYLNGADLGEADLRGATLRGATLHGANLHGARLIGANLIRANLNGADLNGAYLSEANLSEADLFHANLRGATLRGARLIGADLIRANLNGADLRGATLRGATLRGANLFQANLSEVNLRGADLSEARTYKTLFANVDLSGVKGLDEVSHTGPSTIGIDTIYRSGGNIHESFLRGCGLHDTFITFVKSLVGEAIEYYSAFISYSSSDDDLAQRIYNDLQAKDVRCWLAPEDLKIGDKFRLVIEDSIRLHDKLMLILSKQSIASKWVKYEVENALDREVEQDKLILFPIRIDNAVMETDVEWAARIKRTRHIGDFTSWKDHDSYKKSLERLLRDLKADDNREGS